MDKIVFDKLVEALGFDGAMGLAQSTIAQVANAKGPRRPNLRLPLLVEKCSNVPEAVAACFSACTYVSWSQAHSLLFEGDFRSANIAAVIAAFEAVEFGASALIVDERGYHKGKIAERHRAYLTLKGYKTFPGVK